MSDIGCQLDQVIDDALDEGRVVGTAVLVAHQGAVVYRRYAGRADREAGLAVTEDSVFRLASMAKPIVSAAALALVERGALTLDTPVHEVLDDFCPRLADGTTPTITLRHLLTHTAGLTYGYLNEDNEPYHSAGVSDGTDRSPLTLRENLRRLAEVPLAFPPGTMWGYSLATDVVGAMLEVAVGSSLPEVVTNLVTGPLAMSDTGFVATDPTRLTAAYADSGTDGGLPRRMGTTDELGFRDAGRIRFAPGRAADPTAFPSGGIGMVGTARDYLTFLEAIRTGGSPILSGSGTEMLTTDAVRPLTVYIGPGFGWSHGFAVIRDPAPTGSPRPVGSYGWGGVYGTHSFVDPIEGLSVVALTNTALEGMAGAYPFALERAVYQGVGSPDTP